MSASPEPTHPSARGIADAAPANGAAPLAADGDMLPAAAAGAQVVHPRRIPVQVPRWLLAPAAPLVRVAAAAGGGFFVGVALMGLVHRRRRRSALASRGRRGRPLSRAKRAQASRRGAELVQVVGSRSLLVDVHLLGDR